MRATSDEVELHKEERVQSDLIIQLFDNNQKKNIKNLVKNKLMYLVGKYELQDVENFTKLWGIYLSVTNSSQLYTNVPMMLYPYHDDLVRLKSYS